MKLGGLGLGVLTGDIGSHDDFLAQQLADALGDDLQAQLRLPLALGLAHVRAQDDRGRPWATAPWRNRADSPHDTSESAS